MTHYPKGWGLYLTRRSYTRPLSEVSKKAVLARQARVRTVVLLLEAEDGYIAPAGRLHGVAQTYRELASCEVYVYSLPGHASVTKSATEAGERLAEAVEALDARGPVADIERAFRGRPDAARAFLRPLLQLDPRTRSLGVSSYPIMRIHPTMPWEVMRWGWGNPQIYKTAMNRPQARRAIDSWREAHGGIVVPAIAGYDTESPGDGVAQLRGDANRVLLNDEGVCDLPGALVWAEPALDREERRFMAEWAERWGW